MLTGLKTELNKLKFKTVNSIAKNMKPRPILIFLMALIVHTVHAQVNCNELYSKKFTQEELSQDFDFIKTKILNAHANPFSTITPKEFEKKCIEIRSQLKDGLTQREFHFLVKPLLGILNDEHAGLDDYCLPDSLKQKQNSSHKSGRKENPPAMSYKKVKEYGYLTVNTFDDNSTFPYEIWANKIDSVFLQIQKDKVQKLVIDVQNNSGGNSAIGSLLIDYFSNKPYKTYQGKWKKSQEYSDFLKGYGYVDSIYESITNGNSYPIEAQQIQPSENKNRFTGKTYVVIGKNTFSSALMFGVITKDNKLATVIGESPEKGHPNHFGELIVFQTPNTKLEFWFGVKEWIRPGGQILPNKLVPDKQINLDGKSEEQIIDNL